jgi:GNAT superfamily N-acetyltransferase
MLIIRAARAEDGDAIWAIQEPVFRTGETYGVAADIEREAALAYWFSAQNEPFVAEQEGRILGTYFLRPNYGGGGRHVANCGYMTAAAAQGKGVARAMLEHSLSHAKSRVIGPCSSTSSSAATSVPSRPGEPTVSRSSAGCRAHSSIRDSALSMPW